VLIAKAIEGSSSAPTISRFPQDVEPWCKKTGNPLVSTTAKHGYFEAQIRRAK